MNRFVLDQAQIEQFQRAGYVHVPGMFHAETVAALAGCCDELKAAPEVPGRHMVYYEDDRRRPGARIVSRIENFCPFHDGLDRLFNAGPALGCLAQLFGEPAVLFKDKINYKLPGGDGFKAHQDVQAGWDVYGSLHITLFVGIDDTTVENGCLELAPGMHREGLLGEMWKPLADPDPRIRYVSCPTRGGDGVLFDSFIPHRSGPNTTDQPRRVLYLTYNKASEGDFRQAYYAEKRRNYPPDCERDPTKSYSFKV